MVQRAFLASENTFCITCSRKKHVLQRWLLYYRDDFCTEKIFLFTAMTFVLQRCSLFDRQDLCSYRLNFHTTERTCVLLRSPSLYKEDSAHYREFVFAETTLYCSENLGRAEAGAGGGQWAISGTKMPQRCFWTGLVLFCKCEIWGKVKSSAEVAVNFVSIYTENAGRENYATQKR